MPRPFRVLRASAGRALLLALLWFPVATSLPKAVQKELARCSGRRQESASGCAQSIHEAGRQRQSQAGSTDSRSPRLFVVTMFKRLSTLDLVRFLDYHFLLGVHHAVLIDNNCAASPALSQALEPYIQAGLVTLEERYRCAVLSNMSVAESLRIRRGAAERVLRDGDFVLELDDDEMVVLADPRLSLADVVQRMHQRGVCALRMPWRVYGTSGHRCQPPGGSYTSGDKLLRRQPAADCWHMLLIVPPASKTHILSSSAHNRAARLHSGDRVVVTGPSLCFLTRPATRGLLCMFSTAYKPCRLRSVLASVAIVAASDALFGVYGQLLGCLFFELSLCTACRECRMGNFHELLSYSPRAAEFPGKTLFQWNEGNKRACGRHACPSDCSPPHSRSSMFDGATCSGEAMEAWKTAGRDEGDSSRLRCRSVLMPDTEYPPIPREAPLFHTSFWDTVSAYETSPARKSQRQSDVAAAKWAQLSPSPSGQLFWINHYLFQSEEYWYSKRNRGPADNHTRWEAEAGQRGPPKSGHRDMEGFEMLQIRIAAVDYQPLRECVFNLFLLMWEERRQR